MFRAGQEIGLYTLIKRIGRGSFGEVWLAERRAKFVTTKVAVKLPLEEQVDVEEIKSEAVLWEQASGHPNILPIIDADEYDGQIVIVSEYAPDGSLDQLLQKTGILPTKNVVELVIGILSGLEFLHSRKIIHRDLKPANILLQGETPRLADFGISRVMKTTNVSENISGTPAYMAPEAFDRKRTAQTDIWSVGVILYQMLKGSLPFPHRNLTDMFGAIVRDEPEPLPDSAPQALRQIVLKSLAKEPGKRYQTAREMRDKLSDFLISISQQDIQPQQTERSLETIPDGPGAARQSNEILGSTRSESQKTRSNYRYAKIFAPVFLLILLFAGVFYLYRSSSLKGSGVPSSAQIFRYYIAVEPESLDPHLIRSDPSIVVALFDGLTELDVAGRVRPSIAASWAPNADATVWIFYLQRDARWSDKTPITAQDFVYSWKRALSPNARPFSSESPLLLIKNASEFTDGKTQDIGVRAIDDYTLEVTLTKSAAHFDKVTILPVFRPVPRQAIERWGAKLWTTPENIITSGAFKISEKKSDEIILERNPLFWDDANTQLNQIIFKYSPDKNYDRGLKLYEQGEVDAAVLMTPPLDVRKQLKDRKDLFVSYSGITYLWVNLNVKPLDDIRVRQALNIAIPREMLADDRPLLLQAAYTLVPPMEGYEGVPAKRLNLNSARRLLAEAGFPQGRGFPKIELFFVDVESDKKLFEPIRENWSKELGIEIQLTPQHFTVLLPNIHGKKFNGLARGIWLPDYPDPYTYLEVISEYGFKDAKYDDILQRASKELDPDRRSGLLREAESYALEQVFIIPLMFRSSPKLCKPHVKNFTVNFGNQLNFRSLYIKN